MNGETGYLYFNLANTWPNFELHELAIAPSGALMLAPDNEDVATLVQRGAFRGGPFEVLAGATPWYRIRVSGEPLPADTHVQLFTFTANDGDAPGELVAEDPFPGWQAAPRDVLDSLIPSPPARYLWIGGLVHGDGSASPSLHQIRADYGRNTSLKFLPALYGREEGRRDLLERFLSLHESALSGLEEALADLPRLFDPLAVPDDEYPSWLSWLAGWLAFDLNEAWSEAETREYLAQAFDLHGQRGTPEGLRRYLKRYAGIEARIEEPGLQTTLWSLGETSTLGFTTMLAPAHPQGAVVGTSATLDQSHLIRSDDFGAPLFEDLAHRFCVQVYCVELARPGALEDVQAVLERERPAHADYHVCVIEPRMRVGAQARVGIDAIIAAGPPPARTGMVLGTGTLVTETEVCETATRAPAGERRPCKPEEET